MRRLQILSTGAQMEEAQWRPNNGNEDVVSSSGSTCKATAVRSPPEECYLRAKTSRAPLTVRY
jgi:hypothetical protein